MTRATLGFSAFHPLDDLLQVGVGVLGIYAAQAVVGPQFEDEDIDGAAQEPVNAAQSTG